MYCISNELLAGNIEQCHTTPRYNKSGLQISKEVYHFGIKKIQQLVHLLLDVFRPKPLH